MIMFDLPMTLNIYIYIYIYILIFKTFRILAVNITGHFIVKRQVANIIDKFLFIVK